MTEADMSNAALPNTGPLNSGTPNGARPGGVSLDAAIDMLRYDVPVREDWRDSVLRELSEAPRPERTLAADFLPDVPGRVSSWRRSFSVQPVAALAACMVAMMIGAAGTFAFVNRSDSALPTRASASDAPIPLVNAANVNGGADKRQMIRFALVAPGAAHVSVVGDFNNWDPKATPLKTSRDGSTWLIEMPLAAGRHVYAFVVDGDIVADPSAPRVVDHDFGVQNSVILVGSL